MCVHAYAYTQRARTHTQSFSLSLSLSLTHTHTRLLLAVPQAFLAPLRLPTAMLLTQGVGTVMLLTAVMLLTQGIGAAKQERINLGKPLQQRPHTQLARPLLLRPRGRLRPSGRGLCSRAGVRCSRNGPLQEAVEGEGGVVRGREGRPSCAEHRVLHVRRCVPCGWVGGRGLEVRKVSACMYVCVYVCV